MAVDLTLQGIPQYQSMEALHIQQKEVVLQNYQKVVVTLHILQMVVDLHFVGLVVLQVLKK